jgi:hypothetical protein
VSQDECEGSHMTCEAASLTEMRGIMALLARPEPGEPMKAAEARIARILGWNPFRVRDYRLGRARSVPLHEYRAAERLAQQQDRRRLHDLEVELMALRARLGEGE